MGKIGKIKVSLTLLILFLFTVMVLSVSVANAEAKKEKVKISIGQIPHLTGAYAAGQVGINDAFMDTVKWANEHNYIPGVELVPTWSDGGTDVGKSIAAFKKMIAETPRPVTILGESTATGIALKSWHLKEKIPDVEGGSSVDFFQLPSWTFSYVAPYVNQTGAYIDYFLKHIWKEKRAPRFAWLTWDNPFGRAPITPEVEAYIKSKGIELVGAEFLPQVPTDTTAHLLRLKNLKVDVVYGSAYHNAYAVVLKDASKLGMLGSFSMGLSFAFSPTSLIQQVGPLANGLWQTGATILEDQWPTKAPRMQEAYEKNKRSSDKQIYTWGVWITTIGIEGIKMAVEKVGAEKVDGQAVYDALCRMKNFDNWGVATPTTFSETRRYGQDQVFIYHIENEKVKLVEMFPTPELIPGGRDVPK